MLFCPGLSSFLWTYSNEAADPATSLLGTGVTPGTSDAEGAFTQIASSGNIANDVYWVHLNVSNGSSSTNAQPHILDLGVDPAGGTSYTAVVSNLVCGASATITSIGCGHHFFFPLFIKAGSSVAVRIQGSNASATATRVLAKFYGQPSEPSAVPVATFSETIGTITGSSGVSFTPGNAADGTWVSLGTTAKAMWWWQLGYHVNNGTITAESTYIDLAVGDGSNKKIIKRLQHLGTATEMCGSVRLSNLMFTECYCPVPAGGELWVRGRCNNAPDSGYSAVAVGFGG